MRRRGLAAAAALCLTASVLAGCSEEEPLPTATAADPALRIGADLDGPVRVGVLVPAIEGPGSEFRPLVEGARVATYRFGLGGSSVELAVALDDGSEAGAAAAMRSLLDDDVTGVVAASSGEHLEEALALADAQGLAVVLPYSGTRTGAGPAGDGTWSIAPTGDAVQEQVSAALAQAGAERPYLARAPGRTRGWDAPMTGTADDPGRVAQEIVAALEQRQVDSVVIDAGATEQAALVVALQEVLGARQMPVVLTPEALTPAFGDAVLDAGASVGLVSAVGTRPAEQEPVFYAALRLAAGDPACRNLYGDDTCAAGVPRAGIAAHDATVALIRAAEAAGTTDRPAVRDALAGLRLGRSEGLAGPDLDFRDARGGAALADRDVVVLHASASPSGLRPATGDLPAERMSWFVGADG